MSRVHLAVTVHDPGANFRPGLERMADRVAATFAGIGALVTEETAEPVARFLAESLGARVDRAASDVGAIGRHRRRSVELALAAAAPGPGPDVVLYSDVDHVLRWIASRPDEIHAALAAASTTDLLVVGRTDAAMGRSPRRLRDTERVVNHIYELMTGRRSDLMFAVRGLSPAAARVVVDECTEDTIANDVEWPLAVEAAGLDLGWFAADGLTYRVRQDFDADADHRDHDPAEWIERIELAADHVRVLKAFLSSSTVLRPR
jgi:hypothetical protein